MATMTGEREAVRAPTRAPSGPHRVLRPWRPGLAARVADLWRYRGLTYLFAQRLLQKRYSRTWLGILWLPLRPALDVGLRVLVFGAFLGVTVGDRPYFVFFVVGMSAWATFERTAYWATRSLEVNRSVLKRFYLPRTALVSAAIGPALLEFAIYVVLTIIVTTAYKVAQGSFYLHVTGMSLLLALAGLVLLVVFGLAIGLWTSPFAVRARDVRFSAHYVLGFWFFITPVIYPIGLLPQSYRAVAIYNPVTAPVELFKAGLLSTDLPSWTSMGISLGTIAVVLLGGLWFVSRVEADAVHHS